MSSIKEKVSDAMKTHLKAGDKLKLTYARNLYGAIRKREIDERKDLEDTEIHKLIATLVKQRQDSIDQFKQGGRADLVAQEEGELAFLQSFLPAQLSEAELVKIIDDAVRESGATSPKDMGKVMKVLMPKTQGKADGKLISQLVQSRLK